MRRREFLSKSALMGGALMLPWNPSMALAKDTRRLCIGLIADLHNDVMHDGEERLRVFLKAAAHKKADFILQMGDFCVPKKHNERLMELWNSHIAPAYHILGNHDTDGGFTRKQTMDFWGMKKRYYAFDMHGFHFVILDGNDPNPKPWSGYNRYIGEEQQEWLRRDLAKTNLHTFVFSHQTLENEDGGVANFDRIRKILEEANHQAGGTKVVAGFSGHHHTDYMTDINGIYYIQINSASYRWVGEDYLKIRYGEEIDKKFPWIKYTIPYKDPLFTFLEIDPAGILKIEPRSTEFVGPGPEELGMPARALNDPIVPKISDFHFNFENRGS
ncbi:MAG: metallophosphoesterase [Cytophagales bacterium]|nr:metallophosphoesterase [Cytophagales bacterium]